MLVICYEYNGRVIDELSMHTTRFSSSATTSLMSIRNLEKVRAHLPPRRRSHPHEHAQAVAHYTDFLGEEDRANNRYTSGSFSAFSPETVMLTRPFSPSGCRLTVGPSSSAWTVEFLCPGKNSPCRFEEVYLVSFLLHQSLKNKTGSLLV